MIRDDLACASVQVTCAGVVTQPGPKRQHVFQRGTGERGDRWIRFQETGVIRDDGLYLRLLQHDFRQPDAIGIGRLLPR